MRIRVRSFAQDLVLKEMCGKDISNASARFVDDSEQSNFLGARIKVIEI